MVLQNDEGAGAGLDGDGGHEGNEGGRFAAKSAKRKAFFVEEEALVAGVCPWEAEVEVVEEGRRRARGSSREVETRPLPRN